MGYCSNIRQKGVGKGGGEDSIPTAGGCGGRVHEPTASACGGRGCKLAVTVKPEALAVGGPYRQRLWR